MGLRDWFTSKKIESKVVAPEPIKLDPAAQELEDALNLLKKRGYCLTHFQPNRWYRTADGTGAYSCATCEYIYKLTVEKTMSKAIEVVKRSRISGN